MRIGRIVYAAAIACGFVLCSLPAIAQAAAQSGSVQAASVKSFLGRWDLTLKAPDREYPSWIEIQQENGQLSARFVGRWGNARPLPKIEISGTHISFVSPKEEEASKEDMVFEGTLALTPRSLARRSVASG